MKKILLTTILATLVGGGAAFASSMPIMNFNSETARVNFDRGLNQSITGEGGHHRGYSASFEAGLGHKWAAQYSYTRFKSNKSVSSNELMGVYRINRLVNVYASMMNVHMPYEDAKWGYQAGVIGYMPVF